MDNFFLVYKKTRDGSMTPQQSWNWRHGGSFLGNTFHVGVLFEVLSLATVQELLLEAVKIPMATDIQMHFNTISMPLFRGKMEPIFASLCEEGFLPYSVSIKQMRGVQSMRLPLFTKNCLPETPYPSTNA